jgi:tetratricopeptide (TPR) repeat protein
LLFLFLYLATGTLWKSWLAAFFFALHPLHVESVAWIAERKDVLSTFFFMLTLLSYYRYCKRPSLHRYGLVILFFVLGLSSKAMLVSVPFLLLFLDYWPLKRYSFNPQEVKSHKERFTSALVLLREKIPFFLMAIVFSIITIYSQKTGGAVVSQIIHPLTFRMANALTTYVAYIGKMFFPYDLAALYPFPSSISAAKTLSAAFLLLGLTWLAIKLRKTMPYVISGWFWYTVSLFPVIGLIQVGPQAMADRFTYIPLIGLFILCVWAFHEIAAYLRINRIFISIAAGLIIFIYSALCWQQISHWQDTYTLFTRALSVTENNYVAHAGLGNLFSKQGKLEDAADHFHSALKIAPGYKTAHIGYGITLAKMQRLPAAEFHFKKALEIDPDFTPAHYNLGLSLYRREIMPEAAYHFEQALQLQPDHPKAHYYLGNILAHQGKIHSAIVHFQKALEILPHDARIQKNLERARATLRKVD